MTDAGWLRLAAVAFLLAVSAEARAAAPDPMSAFRDTIRAVLPKLREVYPPGSIADIVNPESPRGAGLQDGSELLLTLQLGRYVLDDALYGEIRGGRLFLNAQQLFDAVDFPIRVDPDDGSAEGWYIRPENTVAIDPAAGTATIRGEARPIGEAEIRATGGDVLMSQRLLELLFDVRLRVDYRALTVGIDARETLPLQAALARRERAGRIVGSRVPPPQHPPSQSPDAPSSVLDVQTTMLARSNDSGRSAELSSFSLGYSADAFGGIADAFVSGDQQDPVRNLSLGFGYDDPDRRLLGPLRASQLKIGDVQSTRQTQLRSGNQERGVAVSNRPLGTASGTGSAVIEGNIPPGWDIELYRNDILVDFQTSDSSGRYEFRNVPVVGPDDELKLAFHGPQGQQYEEIVPYAPLTDDFGQRLTYEASITQQGSVIADDLTEDTSAQDDGGMRASARIDYRLEGSRGLALGMERFQDQGRQRLVSEADYNFGLNQGSGSVRFAKDWNGGESTGLLLRDRIGPASLRVEHSFFNDFTRAGQEPDGLTSELEVDASSNLSGLVEGAPPVNLISSVEHDYYDTGQQDLSVSAGFGVPVAATTVSNDLRWSRTYGIDSGSGVTTSGVFQLHHRLRDLRIRGRMTYDLRPEVRLTEGTANLDWQVDDAVRPAFELRHSSETATTRAAAGVNWDLGFALVSPRLAVDSQGTGEALLTVRFGATRDAGGNLHMNSRPLGGAGVAIAHVFLDEDEDGRFGPGDSPIEGARVEATQLFSSAETDADGRALLSDLRPHQRSDFQVAKGSLPDEGLRPDPGGVSTRTAPGIAVNLDLPVVRTWEIEGTVLARAIDGQLRPVAGVTVSLRQLDGGAVHTVATDPDGQFVVSGVRRGLYALSAEPVLDRAIPLLAPPARRLALGPDQPPLPPVNLILADDGQVPYFRYGLPDSAMASARFVPLHAAGSGDAQAEAAPAVEPGPGASHLLYLGRFDSRFGLFAAWREIYAHPDRPVDLPPAWLMTHATDGRHRLFAGPARDDREAAELCRKVRAVWAQCAVVPVPHGLLGSRTS